MIAEQNHIIQKVNIDIDVPDLKSAWYIYNNFSNFWSNSLLPQIELGLNDIVIRDRFIRYEILSFNFSTDSPDKIESVLSERLTGEIIRVVTGVEDPRKAKEDFLNADAKWETDIKRDEEDHTIITTAQAIRNNFLFFLQYGRQNWNLSSKENWLHEKLLKETIISSDKTLWLPLLSLLAASTIATGRMVNQFTDDFYFFILNHLADDEKKEVLNNFKTAFNREEISGEVRQQNLVKWIQQFSHEIINKNHSENKTSHSPAKHPEDDGSKLPVQNIINETTTEVRQKKDLTSTKNISDEVAIGYEAGIYVQHGGLILLHPFLRYFFKHFDLLSGEDFTDEQSKEIAVHLLYFLGTGNMQPFEHELIFEKHMCGWPHHIPLNRFISITGPMRQEAEQMLNAVIHHWKVLKNTSPDGLREGFLQRNGKLILTDHQHKLILEKNSIDILLDRLPWSHSIIALPWMKKVLHAEWQTS